MGIDSPEIRNMLAGRFPVRQVGQDRIPNDTVAEFNQACDVLFLDAYWNLGVPAPQALSAVQSFADGSELYAKIAGHQGPQELAVAREFIADLRAEVLANTARQTRAALPLDLAEDLGADLI